MKNRLQNLTVRSGNAKGFTLIELLVVIAIIAVLVAFAVSNFLGARQRAKDVKKKAELSEMKNALRLFYNDYARYPGGTTVNDLNGCGVNSPPDTSCITACGGQFAAGGTTPLGCQTVYMKLLPQTTDYAWNYSGVGANGEDFCLYTTLDNASDPEIAKSQIKCNAVCSGIAPASSYVLCAD